MGIELERLGIGDVQLGGEVHLLPYLFGILHDRYIRGDDGTQSGGFGMIDDLAHQRQILRIHDGIEGEVGLDPCFPATGYNGMQVVGREIGGRAGAHIQVLYTEIDTRGAGIYRRSQTLPAAYRSHDIYHLVICHLVS